MAWNYLKQKTVASPDARRNDKPVKQEKVPHMNGKIMCNKLSIRVVSKSIWLLEKYRLNVSTLTIFV